MTNSFQGNPDLKSGPFVDKGNFCDASIVTEKEGASVAGTQVDKKADGFRAVERTIETLKAEGFGQEFRG